MVLKLLGIGKKSEYFLEAPPSSNGASSETQAAAPATKPAVKETAKPAEAAPEATTNGSAPAAAPEKPAAKKKATKTKTEAAAPAQPVVAPQPVAKAAPEIKNFATNGLMPMSTPRRRPGPSLAMFKDMARDVTPRK